SMVVRILLAYSCDTPGGFPCAVPGGVHDLSVAGFPFSRSWPQNRVVMSMQPCPWPEVPTGTARIARKAFRKGTLAIRARDELGSWCDDEAFAAAYGVRGRPGLSPAQLAMVTVLQFTEDLTDRQAADAVRGRLDWKWCGGGWTGSTAWAWRWRMRGSTSRC
ncbi:MAG: transposase, partial [Candidatus Dormibacteria bacterium]